MLHDIWNNSDSRGANDVKSLSDFIEMTEQKPDNRFNGVVSNAVVYDLESCIKASKYPMNTSTEECTYDLTERQEKLAQTRKGQGHDQFLTGVRVSFDLCFSNKAWVEAERYRFLEFVSSQSTMHRISKFELDKQYISYVDHRMIEVMNELKDKYNETQDKEDYLRLLYSNPCGFRLTARMTTNYRCLKGIYSQRRNHRLPEWQWFCDWIETLPLADKFIILKDEKEYA